MRITSSTQWPMKASLHLWISIVQSLLQTQGTQIGAVTSQTLTLNTRSSMGFAIMAGVPYKSCGAHGMLSLVRLSSISTTSGITIFCAGQSDWQNSLSWVLPHSCGCTWRPSTPVQVSMTLSQAFLSQTRSIWTRMQEIRSAPLSAWWHKTSWVRAQTNVWVAHGSLPVRFSARKPTTICFFSLGAWNRRTRLAAGPRCSTSEVQETKMHSGLLTTQIRPIDASWSTMSRGTAYTTKMTTSGACVRTGAKGSKTADRR